MQSRVKRNSATTKRTSEDPHRHELLRKVVEDAEKRRMSAPRTLCVESMTDTRLSAHFGVEQGVKKDGSAKMSMVVRLSVVISSNIFSFACASQTSR